MELMTLASGSKGNCYLLNTDNSTLIIDAGVPFAQVKQALGFNTLRIAGAFVSHEHGDHSRYEAEYAGAGITTITPYKDAFEATPEYETAGLHMRAFDLQHDVTNYGFVLHSLGGEKTSFLYATDTAYIKYRFTGIEHILVGCNYDDEYVDEQPEIKRRHVLQGHMSLTTCKEFIRACDSEKLKTVVLCHMGSYINELKAIEEIQSVTAAKVYSAHLDRRITLC